MNINEPTQSVALALPFTKAADPKAEFRDEELRIPFANRIPIDVKNHFVAMCGEYVGTVLFLFFALSGTQVANSIHTSSGATVEETGANPQQLQYIALCFGFSLAVNAWVFFRISGGLFNPAVTVGMCLIGALPWIRGSLLFFVQVLGGMTAAALVSCMFPGDLLVHTTLGGGTSIVQGLFIEMILTAELVFTIFMLAAEKHKGTFIAPVGIGLSLFVAELTGVYFTGGSLNPARTFGPAVVDRRFEGYHWIYWLGPILGAIVAAGFFKFIKVLEYETANPDQDTDQKKIIEKKIKEHRRQLRWLEKKDEEATLGGTLATSSTNESNGATNDSTKALSSGVADSRPSSGARPPVMRSQSSRAPAESPAMANADEAFTGLAYGMHGRENIAKAL